MDDKYLEAILVGADRKIRLALLEAFRRISNEYTRKELETLIAAGRLAEAYDVVDKYMDWFAKQVTIQFVLAGQATAEYITQSLKVIVSFDQVNVYAVQAIKDSQLRIVSNFAAEQKRAIRRALIDGVTRGLNPNAQAELFKSVVGLTESQVNAVISYRQLLQRGSTDALNRALRDRRFDPSLYTAAREEKPLTKAQIDRMVQRYIERSIAYRARVIARTEALRAANEGSQNMYSQAINAGALTANDLIQTWVTAKDEKVRSSHASMHGQKRTFGEPFLTGRGSLIRFPGDTSAPVRETIQCRCVLTTRLKPIGDL